MPDAGPPDDGGPPPGRDGDILPPRDAGDPFGDAGPLGPPEWHELEIRTDGSPCPELIACGGDVLGTWDVSGGCFEVMPPMELMRCPGAALTGATGRARGRVTFDTLFAHRVAQSEVTAEMFIPAICAEFIGGCPEVERRVQMRFPDSACVETPMRDCECAIRQTNAIDDRDAYNLDSNQIVSISSGKRWDYCVEGDLLRYRDVSPSGPREAGIISLERR